MASAGRSAGRTVRLEGQTRMTARTATAAALTTLLAASVGYGAPAAAQEDDDALYVLDGSALYRVVPDGEDVKVVDDVGPGVPAVVSAAAPAYPPDMDEAWVIELEAVIEQDGAVEDAAVVRSQPFAGLVPGQAWPRWVVELNAAAVTALEQRKYRPVLLRGEAVRTRISVVVVYVPPEAGETAPPAGQGQP